MNPQVDNYLVEGCGRCSLGGTPDCKVHTWEKELKQLRFILLDCGLTEEVKWSIPCYTFQKKNILLLSAFKDYCALSFFKGALLKDPENILVQQTENVQSTRQIRFTEVQKVFALEPVLKSYILEAIEIEKSGEKVPMKKTSDFSVPEELQIQLDCNASLKKAFETLTPGRQKGYLLYFSGAKHSKTRASRVEKYIPRILEGKGFHDR
jgi:uncharacterized protein YdeI (YjbR/CyaY-like superfamily)